MSNIKINEKNHTIEITKKFAAAAKRFGTHEYDDLQTVRRDYPKYRVITKNTKKKNDTFKGLTYGYMETYIRTKDPARMEEFKSVIKQDDNGKKPTYAEVKQWFLDCYRNNLTLTNRRVEKRLMEAA